MDLLKPNFIDTITGIVVDSNTTTAEYIMNPDPTFQWVSSGFNSDLTTATMRINFSQTLTVSRIALLGLNLKDFSLYYNGATASTFALTSTCDTNASSWNANSETGLYLHCNPVACTSVSIAMRKTMVADAEKAIGYFMISEERLNFSRIPAAKNYSPLTSPKEVVHKLSNGTTRVQGISTNRWSFDVKLEYISESLRDSLYEIWKLHQSHIYVPFGTTTGWDQAIAPVVWPGAFDFFKYSDNAVGAGFEGSLHLMETDP